MPRRARDVRSQRNSGGVLVEKRREERVSVEGVVRIFVEEYNSTVAIDGKLVDLSPSGFRAAHNHFPLIKGQTVEFEHIASGGRARVVWNRITGDLTETGFLVL